MGRTRTKTGWFNVVVEQGGIGSGSADHLLVYNWRKEYRFDRWEYMTMKERGGYTYRDMLALRKWEFNDHRTSERFYSLTDWENPFGNAYYHDPDYPNVIGWMGEPVKVVIPKLPDCCLNCRHGDQGNHGDEPTSCSFASGIFIERHYGGVIKCPMYKRHKYKE